MHSCLVLGDRGLCQVKEWREEFEKCEKDGRKIGVGKIRMS